MAKNIKAVFADIASELAIDKALIKRLHAYEREFVNRNDDHIQFFGGNLLGVERPRFKTSDWNNWFDEILRIDDVELRTELHALPTIEPKFIVTSDVMYLSCVWLVHAIFNSNLPAADKHQGMIDTLLIFQYRTITSKIAWDFKFSVNRDVAIATYAALSKKFHLKKYGTWGKVLIARAEDIISRNSIHYQTIRYFDKDKKVTDMVSDVQGRVREMIKNQWDTLNSIRENDAKIVSTTGTMVVEGEEVLRDLNRSLTKYKNYIQSIVPMADNFFKQQVYDVVCASMTTMNPQHLLQALLYISEEYTSDKQVETLVNETMIHAFDVLHREKEGKIKHIELSWLIVKLRGVYMSSRSTDKTLLDLRKLTDEICAKSTKTKNASALAAVRTGVLLYIVTRAFAMKHYSS